MRRLVSFLGLGPGGGYQEVTYFWDEDIAKRSGYRGERRELSTPLFPIVAFEIARPDELILFCTAESINKSLARLADGSAVSCLRLLEDKVGDRLRVREIPSNVSRPKDLWRMFELMESAADIGDELFLDVTHSFRSIPLISISIVYYLNAVKGVRVVDVLYGAFEARGEHGDKAPVLSLLGFFDVIEWAEGLKLFRERFDASALARKLREIQGEGSSSVHLAGQAKSGGSSRLREVSDALDWLSASMSSSSLMGVSESARLLGERLEAARAEVEEMAKPFRAVLAELKEDLRRFSLQRPEELTPGALRAQMEIIKRMFKAGLYLQTALALREWLLSWVMLLNGLNFGWLDWNHRERVSASVGNAAKGDRRSIGASSGGKGPVAEANPRGSLKLESLDKGFLELWLDITDLRNRLAHCGIAKGKIKPEAARGLKDRLAGLLKGAERLLEQLPQGTLAQGLSEIDLTRWLDR